VTLIQRDVWYDITRLCPMSFAFLIEFQQSPIPGRQVWDSAVWVCETSNSLTGYLFTCRTLLTWPPQDTAVRRTEAVYTI